METNIYGWKQYSCPEAAQWLSVSSQFVCIGGPHSTLYCSPLLPSSTSGLRWQKLKYEAALLILSPTCKLIWRIDESNVAYSFVDLIANGKYSFVINNSFISFNFLNLPNKLNMLL